MNIIPDGLITQATKFEPTGSANILKPVFGNVGGQHAEFRQYERYSGKDSVREGKEVRIKQDIVLIQSDKFSKVPKRMNELSQKEAIDLAPLYERFKTQKDSTDTPILTWEAATDLEKVHLGQLGIWTVQQLNSIPEHESYKLGPMGADLRKRAARHCKTEKENSKEEQMKELLLVAEENKKLHARLDEMEKKYFEEQEKKANEQTELQRLKQRPRRQKAEAVAINTEPDTTEIAA